MYIKSVKLENIKGFEKLEFDLTREDGSFAGFTVFTGDNGSGKTTLLKAITLSLLGPINARAIQYTFPGWVRYGVSGEGGLIQLEIVKNNNDDKIKDEKYNKFDSIHIKMGFRKDDFSYYNTKQLGNSNTLDPITIWTPPAPGWFSCAYGPFRRISGASPDVLKKMTASSTERFITLFEESASLAEVDRWLKDLDHKRLENKEQEKKTLELVLKILNDDLMPNQISVDRVDSDGLWLKDRNGVRLSWNDMSDGYRTALALLCDILRHMVKVYGIEDLAGEDEHGKVYIKRSGVVLIDEIDAHLHPEWQREIGFWLKRHFPRIQFLVTTHSPLICQAADSNGLFVLPEPGSDDSPRALTKEEYFNVISARPDTILQSAAFGNMENTRSERAVEARALYAKLSAKKRAGAKLTSDEQIALSNAEPLVNKEELNGP
jgi:predicted ATP-binding protein involved in virulence